MTEGCFSETRLIEVMEYVCKTKNAGNVENNDKFAHGIKDVEFKVLFIF